MDGYTKIFESIVTSTIWQAPNDCRVLWITMLALKGWDNVCTATVPALAKMCDLSIEDTEKYLTQFQEPDRYSRSLEFEGRRIKRVDRGWLILNGQKYRDLLRSSERRDYIREKVREHRERKKAVNISKQSNQCKPIADTDTDTEKEEETLLSVTPSAMTPLALFWNEKTNGLPKVKEISKSRLRKEKLRLKELGEDKLHQAILKIASSSFCRGEDKGSWRATYDWLIGNDENAIKVLEGKYDDKNNEVIFEDA